MMNSVRRILGLLLLSCVIASAADAAVINCGNEYRTATLSSAEACHIGSGNTSLADIDSYFGGEWVHLGGVSSSTTLGFMTVNLLSGAWGEGGPISGSWAIDPAFWGIYGSAALSIHVGNGRYDPDHFAWFITDGQTSGAWSYQKLSGNGGGFSNMHLWGSGIPKVTVPEPNILLLMMMGLLSVFIARRREKR